jgi:DNA-binding PadR family transcriptional regulator
MRARPHRILTPLALAILRLLHERPMHPYEMHQLVRDRGTDFVIKVRAGSLYHAVERLAKLSLIAPVETGREGRRPERTVYAITDAGRDEFMDNLRDLVRSPAEEFPVFAAALEMLATIEPAAARRLLMQRTFALEAHVAGAEQVTGALAKSGLDRINILETEYTQHMLRAELTWVRDLLDDIDTSALTWSPTPHHVDRQGAQRDGDPPAPHSQHDLRTTAKEHVS